MPDTTPADLTEEQRDARRTRARDLIEERLTDTWPAWRRPGRKPNLPLAADIALDALGDLAAEILVDGTMMRALTIRDGVATLELAEATEMVRIFAAGMRGALDGATNYVEMEMTDGSTGEGFTVTVRRRERPTPHELRQQAEARVERLTAELVVARQLLGTSAAEGGSVAEQEPTSLRWGLDDVMYGDDDTTTVLLSGPDREPYWLELDPERTAALRDALDGPAAPPAPADRAAVLREAADFVGNDDTCDCGGCDTCIPRRLADRLRALAADAAAGVQPPTSEARPVETEWVLETLWRTTGEWRRHWPARATRSEAEQDHERSIGQDSERKYRIVRVHTTYTVEPEPAAPAAPEEQAR